jgi:hypothetical protein
MYLLNYRQADVRCSISDKWLPLIYIYHLCYIEPSIHLPVILDGKELRHILSPEYPQLNCIVSKQLVRPRRNEEPSIRVGQPSYPLTSLRSRTTFEHWIRILQTLAHSVSSAGGWETSPRRRTHTKLEPGSTLLFFHTRAAFPVHRYTDHKLRAT